MIFRVVTFTFQGFFLFQVFYITDQHSYVYSVVYSDVIFALDVSNQMLQISSSPNTCSSYARNRTGICCILGLEPGSL